MYFFLLFVIPDGSTPKSSLLRIWCVWLAMVVRGGPQF